MIRKEAIVVVGAVLAVGLLALIIGCQPAGKQSFTIGLVNPNPGTWTMVEGFVQGMAESGYVEGKNVTYIRIREKKNLESEIKTLVDREVDLIFTVTTPATRFAKQATVNNRTPIVFVMHDPVAAGVVNSLPQPGGNLTGIQLRGSTPKALEWLLMIAPKAKHVYVPVAPDTPAAKQSLDDLQSTAKKLGVKLIVREVNNSGELKSALSNLPPETEAIFLLHSILISANVKDIAEQAMKSNIPVGGALGRADDGMMITYASDHFQTGRQASRLAVKILSGTPPEGLPVEVSDFYLGINIESADAAGLKIPDQILRQADFIIRSGG